MLLRNLFLTTLSAGVAACAVASGDDVERARADLAGRLDVPVQEVTVVERVEKTWPDGSLGCPQPGMNYTQALVEGSLLVLEVDGKRYNYHAGGGRGYFLCERLKLVPGGVGPGVDVPPGEPKKPE